MIIIICLIAGIVGLVLAGPIGFFAGIGIALVASYVLGVGITLAIFRDPPSDK